MSTDNNKPLVETDYDDSRWKPFSINDNNNNDDTTIYNSDITPQNPKNAREVVSRGSVNVANNVATKLDNNDNTQTHEIYDSYDDVINNLNKRHKELGNKLPTKEQLAKERRRYRTRALIDGIADSASAIANLFFTTKGAPNMYDATQNMSDKTRQRYNKYTADYENKRNEYDNLGLQIAKLKQQREELSYKRGREQKKDQLEEAKQIFDMEIKEHKDKRDQDKNNAYIEYMQAKTNGVDEQTALTKLRQRYQEIDNEYRSSYNQSVINRNNHSASGRKTSGGKGSSGSKNYTQTTTKKGTDKYGNPTTTTTTTSRTYGNSTTTPKNKGKGYGS